MAIIDLQAHIRDPNAHHAKLHKTTHEAGGSDALPWGSGGGLDVDKLDGKHANDILIGATGEYFPLACRDYDMMSIGGNSTTSTSYVFLSHTRSNIFIPALTGLSDTVYAKVEAQLRNDTSGQTTYVKIAGVEVSRTGTSWGDVTSDWVATSSPHGDGFIKVSGGTGSVGRLTVILARKIIR